MQAEEIIQQKEWHELSAEELKILQPLVADEQEFYLLKKMLLVAKESAEVPVVSREVSSKLHEAVKSRTQRTMGFKKWYYAAAAILIVALTTWLLLIENQQPEGPAIAGTDRSVQFDSLTPKAGIQSPQHDTINRNDIADKGKNIVDKKIAPVVTTIPDKLDTAISTLVKSDTALFAFVTSVY